MEYMLQPGLRIVMEAGQEYLRDCFLPITMPLERIRVNSYTEGNQIYSKVSGLSDGGFLVAWASDGQDGSGYGIYGRKYE